VDVNKTYLMGFIHSI